jgi:hypothetical protein
MISSHGTVVADLGRTLRREVFKCEECTGVLDFQRPRQGGPFYKFPPLIGALGHAPLLFIGINPRKSITNQCLHEWLMNSPGAFDQLAKNRYFDGKPYIAKDGPEPHYHCHAIVVEKVFGRGTSFESVGAVTELFMCASKSAPVPPDTLKSEKSVCAARYLLRVIELVQPDVIVSVGGTVRRHLARHFEKAIRVPVVYMEHPKYLYGTGPIEKVGRLQPTIKEVRRIRHRFVSQPK